MNYIEHRTLFILSLFLFLVACTDDTQEAAKSAVEDKSASNIEQIAEAEDAEEALDLIEIYVDDPASEIDEDSADKLVQTETTPQKDYAAQIPDALPVAYEREVKEEAAEKQSKKTVEKEKKAKKKKEKKKRRKAVISFDETSYNFGRIVPGDVVEHKFYFTNTGKGDLVIKDTKVTCGCTMPSYPFIPIAPGEKGHIGVKYDSKGKLGKQKPTVTLVTNVGTKKIYLEGFVFPEENNTTSSATEN